MEFRLLRGVPPDDGRRLLAAARRCRFRRGEIVFHRGDPADSLHLIVKERFNVLVMTPLGDEATIAIRSPGESFGEMAIINVGEKRSATIEALEDGETFCVSEAEFGRLRREHPGVDRVVIEFLADAVRALNGRLLEAHYVSADRRVLRRLVDLVGVCGSHDGAVEIPLTQKERAGPAGTSRSTVNQVLRAQQRAGTVQLRRSRTIVVDTAALAARATR